MILHPPDPILRQYQDARAEAVLLLECLYHVDIDEPEYPVLADEATAAQLRADVLYRQLPEHQRPTAL